MPAVDVARLDPSAMQGWDERLRNAGDRWLFHRAGVLGAIAAETGTELVPLVATSGAAAVLLPVFLARRGPARVAYSPPPRCAVPDLGPLPLALPAAAHQRESVWLGAIRALDAYIRRELKAAAVHLTAPVGVADGRPLQWSGYAVTPRYTYELDLGAGAAAVQAGFRSQLRTDARRATRYPGLQVVSGDDALLGTLVSRVRARYAEQGRAWGPSDAFFRAVRATLGPDAFTVRAAVVDGEMVSGLGLLASGGVVRHWIGGTAAPAGFIGVNELLHTRVVEEFAGAGFHTYELMGANTEHLCRNKARYGPTLVQYLSATRGGAAGRMAELVVRYPEAAAAGRDRIRRLLDRRGEG